MLVLLMTVLALVGCGKKKDKQEKTTETTTQATTQVSTQATTAATEKETEKQTQKATEKQTEKVTQKATQKATQATTAAKLDEKGTYTSKDDVALYLHTYGKLPSNFITKAEAQKLGWPGGSLEPYAKGKCIGGDKFGNAEGLLPKGEQYYECDIDTLGAKSRGAKRLVFTKSGSIYYTEDHYETFKKLY